ncbi:carboxylesterase [Aspergillus saccharolyticus JOP 1030-1]|uniref:Carboxylic ester hydrolase n=1 Tax=Aspergillus saccharolyticus JOP 1030-1 TaxID=1450539 RepID=A0A319AHA5_9EURO|nr:carboxylesterase [Aspergillus saccharolyticus JOP 1030-1]PYH45992.1 carboxylesterase [Aspergillus saccharolyticus JOP 1030-1]
MGVTSLITSQLLLLLLLALPGLCVTSSMEDALTVHTDTGSYTGLYNPEYPSVREFRSIAYAQPPVGALRWQPPVALPASHAHHNATQFPPACSQYVYRGPAFFGVLAPDYLIWNGPDQNSTAGAVAHNSAEDCLHLAIWTPANATRTSRLPVLVFYSGGQFRTGGIPVPYQLPPAWVNRTQGHIVVTTNYRLNIMGFPNAAGLADQDQNLGILDQRAALEWVHRNIAAFGGDPSAITLWGQSAGAMSVDYHTYAFWDNLLARATISQSGTALKTTPATDPSHSNFTFVAKHLGCDFGEDGAKELDCMRRVPVERIQEFVGQYGDAKTEPTMTFAPVADEKVIFADYAARAAQGYLANTSAIFSNCANEAAPLYPFPSTNVSAGPWQAGVDTVTLRDWLCPTAKASVVRHQAGLKTWRAQWAGNFSDVSPLKWMGAYHSSDLTMHFGTFGIVGGKGTEVEVETSQVMQDYLFEFIKDPEHGLERKGWMAFNPEAEGGGIMKRFGAQGVVEQDVTGDEVQGACWGEGVYDPFP